MKLSKLLGFIPDAVFVRIYDREGNLCFHDNGIPQRDSLLKSDVIALYPVISESNDFMIHVALKVYVDYLG